MGDATTNGQIFVALVAAIVPIVMYRMQMAREKRNREWDLADREAARQKLVKVAEVAHKDVIQKIEENTEISRGAFNEANNVNQKILMLSNQINQSFDRRAEAMRRRAEDIKDDLKDILTTTATKVEETQTTVEDTHAKVESIEKKLP